MSEPIIIGEDKSALPVEERLKLYNEERGKLDKKYGFVLVGEAFIAPDGTIKARPSVMPVENIPKPEPAEEHIHDATTGERIPVTDVVAEPVKE